MRFLEEIYYLKKDGKNSGTYLRIGATNRKASFENILELERQRNNISYDIDFESLDLSPLYNEFEKQNKVLDINKLNLSKKNTQKFMLQTLYL